MKCEFILSLITTITSLTVFVAVELLLLLLLLLSQLLFWGWEDFWALENIINTKKTRSIWYACQYGKCFLGWN